MDTSILDSLKEHEITGAVAISAGQGKLPRLTITTPDSTAEIYLHGAHVTAFKKKGEQPLLWMSKESLFAPEKAIRGGVPICFPWFGARAGSPAHGYGRLMTWHLAATSAAPDGRVTVRLRLPENTSEAGYHGEVEFTVTVGATLTMALEVANHSHDLLPFEECLHAYFTVGDISKVAIHGLQGVHYLDKVGGSVQKTETEPVIRFSSEVDRIYLDATHTVEIEDAKLGRTICVEKTGSASTVVWNPWVEKSRAMADFGDTEYKEMVCVEAGNVGPSKTTLAPGASNKLRVVLSSRRA